MYGISRQLLLVFSGRTLGKRISSTGASNHNTPVSLKELSLSLRMASRKAYQPTPEEIAVAQIKKAERLKKKQAKEQAQKIPSAHSPPIQHAAIIPRPWLQVPVEDVPSSSLTVKIFTWNLLAQCLVRRELFPKSDCLKANQREVMLLEELLSQDASVLCLQEVDRLETVLPILDQAGYSHKYAAGRGKKHGCLIAFKRKMFKQSHERLIYYDEQYVRDTGDERARCGHSFKTRNIGLILALRFLDDPSNGIIIATTHLFWHPKYIYERSRQAGILVREVLNFQRTQNAESWPCFIAGDFNCSPSDATYNLLVNQPLNKGHIDSLALSRVTHVSVDPTIVSAVNAAANDDGEGEGTGNADPDRTITRSRTATREDGLLENEELLALFAQGHTLKSAYDTGLSKIQDHSVALFGERALLQGTQPGFHEPAYTSYTHYWKSVLDYIFFIPPRYQICQVTGFLAPHQTKDFGSGLPLKGVCASDHISLTAEFAWPKSSALAPQEPESPGRRQAGPSL